MSNQILSRNIVSVLSSSRIVKKGDDDGTEDIIIVFTFSLTTNFTLALRLKSSYLLNPPDKGPFSQIDYILLNRTRSNDDDVLLAPARVQGQNANLVNVRPT